MTEKIYNRVFHFCNAKMEHLVNDFYMDYFKRLGKYIKKKRTEAKWSLNKFAIEVEMEASTLSRNENGKSVINIETINKIASFYKQTPAEFLADFEKYDKEHS